MAATYEPIATTTLGTAAATVTFSSIASTWTDLRVVTSVTGTSSGTANIRMLLNNDTTATYGQFVTYSNKASVFPSDYSTISFIALTTGGISISKPALITTDIFSYKGSTYKPVLSVESNETNSTTGYLLYNCCLWRSTSVVNRIDITTGGADTMSIGTTITIYGIKAA